jgi:uncharacterized protein YigA (DUF484 family)
MTMHPTPRLLALLAAVSLLVSANATVAGAEPIGGVPTDDPTIEPVEIETESEEPSGPAQRFPAVPGVDLGALGYRGALIDGDVVERMGEPLPSDPSERVVEIVRRLDLAPPHLLSLTEAESLLRRVVASLDRDLEQARGAVRVHTHRAEVAAQRKVDAQQRLEARWASLGEHQQKMAEVAVAAYVRPPGADALASVMGSAATTTEDLAAGVLFEAKADHDGTVRDSLVVSLALADERVGRADRDAVETADLAERSAAVLVDVERRWTSVRAAHEQVAEARELLDEALPSLQEDLDRTIEESWKAFDLGAVDGAGLPMVEVGGIRVHAAIAVQVQALLAVAHADGVPLGGWGYRSTEQQIALRRAHCGPTAEDVYLKPASACSPPTAQPGASMHERGLAIDFHLDGRSISTRQSPGYQWLAANAARFGLHNLPSEPWHWSVNGQ